MQKWEYRTFLLNAHIESRGAREYTTRTYPGRKLATYAPETMEVLLNALGDDGWELVHMQPVYRGKNDDVMFGGSVSLLWGNSYFVAMKRSLPG